LSVHHLIFTSCAKGIEGVGGQQIYSHTDGFPVEGINGIRDLFVYRYPLHAPLTPGLVASLPSVYTYRFLAKDTYDLPYDYGVIGLNTLLAKDYTGDSGIGSNLSHLVLLETSALMAYPCEFYGEKPWGIVPPVGVRSTRTPRFLAMPKLNSHGNYINPDIAREFISKGSRVESFKKMVAAMLMYNSRTRKRVFICDSPENILRWIAALHYVLPLEIAKKVSFSTYAYDPAMAEARICGVRATGTEYNRNKIYPHFVFDFEADRIIEPDIKVNKYLSQAIDDIPINGFDKDFHGFVTEKLDYRQADEHFYGAVYSLYRLFCIGPSGISPSEFDAAAVLWTTYANPPRRGELASELALALEDYLATQAKDQASLSANAPRELPINCFKLALSDCCMGKTLNYVLDTQTEAAGEFVKAIFPGDIIKLLQGNDTQEDFLQRYSWYTDKAELHSVDLPDEIIKAMGSSIPQDAQGWKWYFVVDDIFMKYIYGRGGFCVFTGLTNSHSRFIVDIVKNRCETELEDGLAMAKQVLWQATFDWKGLINANIKLLGSLHQHPHAAHISSLLWGYVGNIIAYKYTGNAWGIYSHLLKYRLDDVAFNLYQFLLNNEEDFLRAREVYTQQWRLASENRDYYSIYGDEIHITYLQYLKALDDSQFDYKIAALKSMLESLTKGYAPSFFDELVEVIVKYIPLSRPNDDDHDCLINLRGIHARIKRPLRDRMLLLMAGLRLDQQVEDDDDIKTAMAQVWRYAGSRKISLTDLPLNEIDPYIDWILGGLLQSAADPGELATGFRLFDHTDMTAERFISGYVKALDIGASKKNHEDIELFLSFLHKIDSNDRSILEPAAAAFTEISKHMDRMEAEMSKMFETSPELLGVWRSLKVLARRR